MDNTKIDFEAAITEDKLATIIANLRKAGNEWFNSTELLQLGILITLAIKGFDNAQPHQPSIQ